MTGLDVPLTPLLFLHRAADSYPDKTALVDGPRRINYAEMATHVRRLATAVRASGVGSGQHVVYLASNSAELSIAHFGIPLAEAVLVATNTRLASSEIEYILDHCEAKLVCADYAVASLHQEMFARAGVELVILPELDGSQLSLDNATGYDEFLQRGSDEQIPLEVADETATITLNYTSGTTGRPKGVMYTHRGAYLNALAECHHQGFDKTTRYLWTLPMFHCNGWCSAWAVTAVGGTQVCLRAVRGDEIWRLIAEEKVDHMAGAPTVLTLMSRAPEAHRMETPLTVTTAGAAPSPTIINKFNELNCTVVHVYGLTEVYGPYTVCEPQPDWDGLPAEDLAVRMARQGIGMITACEARVVDTTAAEGNLVDVPSDGKTIGEIVMRGNTVMKGYYKDEQATEEAFAGGWFHSGDLGVRHPDGYVQLVDRAKDVVISGGENISTIEVEQALLSHPAVTEAAVIGVPDERWGEVPKAFVILAEGADASTEELIAHVKSRIASYKAPKAVDLAADLPKTATGKIRKNELKEAAWAGRESRIQG